MLPSVKLFILTSLTLVVDISAQSVTPFTLPSDKLDKQLRNAVIQTVWNVTLAGCSRECQYLKSCKSLNFNSVDRLCELNYLNSLEANPNDFVKAAAFVFSDRTDWPKEVSASCSDAPCSSTQKCVPFLPYKCIAWCGDPPVVRNANYDTGDHVMSTEGAVRRYTCLERHIMTSTYNTVTCQPDSIWSPAQFKCIAKCGSTPSVDRALISPGLDTENQTRTYTCQGRHYAPSTQQTSIMCQMNTYWSQIQFSCVLTCATGWTQLHSSCYLYVSETNNWDDAKTGCGRLQQDGHLANVLSREINDMLSTLAPTGWVWIAANRRQTYTYYVWSDNTRVSDGFKNWQSGEPNFANEQEDCVYYSAGESANGDWNDDDCAMQIPAFCEYEMT